jgi:hypothetical protein
LQPSGGFGGENPEGSSKAFLGEEVEEEGDYLRVLKNSLVGLGVERKNRAMK